ncbi:MAG: class I SAM-dependent methyltransferase [Patescibacteria group bacterium]|nr:class I SAM-dependent methyltransferase [Patescibacteria group bacterium]
MADKGKIFWEIHQSLPRQGPGSDFYTEKVFNIIKTATKKDFYNILDIGCGPGRQSMKLAEFDNVKITSIDTHQPFLDELSVKIDKNHLGKKIKVENVSMFDLPYSALAFDVIWAEGSIFIIGIENGLRSWRKYLKNDSCIAFSHIAWIKENPPKKLRDYWRYETGNEVLHIRDYVKEIEQEGYNLIDKIILPPNTWADEYYFPIEKRLKILEQKYLGNDEALKCISSVQREIDIFKKYYEYYSYVFYLIRN